MAFLINPKKIPSMPEHKELDDKYSELLFSLDLPPMKFKEMRSYSDDKKWEILYSSSFVKSQNLPIHYISRLNQLLGLSFFKTKHDATEILRGLEVSLRTYTVDWLKSFLNDDNNKGLDTLTNISEPNANLLTQNNLQIVLQCIKTIFNDKNGFQMIINHENLLNVLTMNLLKASVKNKSLILQLLAIPCTTFNGHCKVLNAFKNYQTTTGSASRFLVLIDFLSDFKNNQTLIVYCLKMIGAIVFKPADVNHQITLQYEFNQLGLEEKLEKFSLNLSHLSIELIEEIDMFKSKLIDVNKLIEHCDINLTAVQRANDLELQLNIASETIQEIGSTLLTRINGVKLKSTSLESEINILSQQHQKSQEGKYIFCSIIQTINQCFLFLDISKIQQILCENKFQQLKRQEQSSNDSLLKSIDSELKVPKTLTTSITGLCDSSFSNTTETILSTTSPPPPPPPPMNFNAPPPPPPLTKVLQNALQIKTKRQSTCKLPFLNWIPLKPNLVRGTIFAELDDEKIMTQINFSDFENKFQKEDLKKCENQPKKTNQNVSVSVLEPNRLRNISICLRKLKVDINTICNAINTYNLTQLSLDNVELLEKVAPNEEEIKLYKNYINDKKDVHALSVEDKFLLNLINIDRPMIKLSIMNYIGNFEDRVNSLDLQLYAVISASHSLKSSKKFHCILELVLTFGNYMNSSKITGPAYGFKLKSLDALTDIKSNDKTTCLLQYIVCETIAMMFPKLLSLDTELLCIDEAARISLINVMNEINDMDKGWNILTKENELRNNSTLKLFEESCSKNYLKLLENSENAKSNFIKCVEYFGESFQAIDSNEFFAIVGKFLKQFKIFACKVKTS